MTEFESLIAQGLRETEPQSPATIKFGALDPLPGILSDVSLEDVAAMGGFTENVQAIFILRKDICPTKPKDKTTAIVNGVARRIGGIGDDVASWNIGLEGKP